MWTLVASLFAMAIFAIVALMLDSHATAAIQEAALSRAQIQSGQLLAQFASAARTDAASKGYTQGTQMTVQTLQNDGALPAGFPPGDAFGLSFKALVGATSAGSTPVVSWTDGTPINLFGLPINSITLQGVEMQVAQNALAAQQNTGAIVGTANGAALKMPFASSAINLSATFPGWSLVTPNAAVVYMN
jgi:type II secretory pathway pseudopilin PulG